MSSAERAPLSRDALAAGAIALADEEGMDAVSMRRVAARLGVGTMTLYHYVRTKPDLLSLMGDAIMGEFVIPDAEVPAGWRAGLAEIARRTKASFDRHPWMLAGMQHGEGGAPGPNLLRHVEQTLAVMAELDIPTQERLHLSGLVDEYVMGHVFVAAVSAVDEGRRQEWVASFAELLAEDEFPHVARMMRDGPPERAGAADRFARGLELVLDGIELSLSRGSAPSRR